MKNLTVKELATKIVGDGKKPNKYFVTIGYGWYMPVNEEEMEQVDNSMDSVSILFTNKDEAIQCYNSISLFNGTVKGITGETIGQVMIEDRLTGTIKEKYLTQNINGTFRVTNF